MLEFAFIICLISFKKALNVALKKARWHDRNPSSIRYSSPDQMSMRKSDNIYVAVEVTSAVHKWDEDIEKI